ncbi:acyl-CoA dehydrogenase family protein [Streptomyces sp. NPDC091268]|uniref:acyl-CoA dehydrogenase family protein n=1 Tax=Streptomyces sp. NPDC091268 TaxID=3365979 RepID=UPI003813BF96
MTGAALRELGELFGEELAPVLRRLGERPRGAGADARPDEEDAATRAAVWATLAELGAFAPQPQPDLVAAAELMGAALYQSPYPDTVTAADLLAALGDARLDPVREAIARGACPVALAVREDGLGTPARPGPLTVHGEPGAHTVDGRRDFVAFAADCAHLLVLATVAGQTVLALVPVDQPGVRLRRRDDIGRGDLYEVLLEGAAVAGDVHPVGAVFPGVLARARIRQAGALAGASRGAVELAAERLKSRRAFGKPLAQHQAPAYRLAALAAETATVAAFARAGAEAAERGEDVRRTGAQALYLAGELARRAAAESVHLHGAYGMTEACDAQLFHRRAAVDAQWLGTGTELLREAAELLAAAHTPAPQAAAHAAAAPPAAGPAGVAAAGAATPTNR